MTITDVLKDDYFEHFVEAVSYSLAIFLTYFLAYKVGGYAGEQLMCVSELQQIYHRAFDVAVLQQLGRFFAEVIDSQH